MRAWIAGATGLTGSALLSLLLREPRYDRVVAFVRRPLTIVDPKLTETAADFTNLREANPGFVDAAFCCLGTTIKTAGSEAAFRQVDHDYVLAFAAAAKAHGAQHFGVVSSLGADAQSRIFYNRVKGETERDLAALGFASLGIYRPSILVGGRQESRPGERAGILLMQAASPLMLGPIRKYRPIRVTTVAGAMLRQSLEAKPGVEIYESDGIQSLCA
ncbi:MAG: oxidoreductase [Bryobacteraceae bacterium]|nr:oxidoreductase [Bryobacteraceae bacterium]